tara:strand:+ start:721 stop:957 length:237 start_codon:yes stop_codon:yes gene_type:complete
MGPPLKADLTGKMSLMMMAALLLIADYDGKQTCKKFVGWMQRTRVSVFPSALPNSEESGIELTVPALKKHRPVCQASE